MSPNLPPDVSPNLSPIVARALRRSRARRLVLLALASLGEAYPAQLAAATGLREESVRFALEGGLPGYRPQLALVVLGLASLRESADGRIYRVTTLGLKVAALVLRGQRVAPAVRAMSP